MDYPHMFFLPEISNYISLNNLPDIFSHAYSNAEVHIFPARPICIAHEK